MSGFESGDATLVAAKKWYEESYRSQGFNAQRAYPNEELLRFFGRNYFGLESSRRSELKVLEVGCGSCANLWMIAHEGFDAYGIDLSAEAIALGNRRLALWEATAELAVGSMTELPFEEGAFDAVCDVFSSYCLDMADFELFLAEVRRVLKPGGRLFSYIPTSSSEAFVRHEPAEQIDAYTLNGIHRTDSPFYGNFYPFRFSDIEWLKATLRDYHFQVTYMETITRSYNGMSESFQHVALEALRGE